KMFGTRQSRNAPTRLLKKEASMATKSKPASKKTTTRSTSASAPDAIALLKADHAEVKKCFQSYQKLVDAQADASERQALAEQICLLLTVHATVEEEIFYPAARELLGEDADLVDEADVEHASAKELIAQIQSME